MRMASFPSSWTRPVLFLAFLWTSRASPIEIQAGSSVGTHLLSHAKPQFDRSLEEQNGDTSFLANFKLKFQGCHHVNQWNDNANDGDNDENDVRIMTKRLVRFRLCPNSSCANDKAAGCTSNYGDFVVDMNTFVEAYLQAMQNDGDEDGGGICSEVATDCQEECGNANDEECMDACYDAYQVSFCYNNGEDESQQDNNELDVVDYAACAQFNLNNNNNGRRLEEEVAYYLGPYCANQGGEIHMGLFTDDTCTTFADNGESTFYETMGYELPFSDDSLISSRCLSCASSNQGNENQQVKDVCDTVYQVSGKCETYMNVDYPNESACTYMEGIKIIRADGVIRTSAVRKSKAAAVMIGLLMTFSVLLGAYVYYLRTKLARARISLISGTPATGLMA